MEILRCPPCGGAGARAYVPVCAVCGWPTEPGAGCEFCPRTSVSERITVECIVCTGLGTVIKCPVCDRPGCECKRCHGFGYVPAKGPGSWPYDA